MMHQNQADVTEPCFITDDPPSNDLPQTLAGINNEELTRWLDDLADAEWERPRKAGI